MNLLELIYAYQRAKASGFEGMMEAFKAMIAEEWGKT